MQNSRAADVVEFRRRLSSDPDDRVTWHNLAAAEGDVGHAAEAEDAARRALALGIAAPETRLVLARALLAQRRLDEAERVFEEALALRPAYVDAHRDLAQLRWMRTGQTEPALRRLESEIKRTPREPGLHWVKSLVLEFSGDPSAALAAAETGLNEAADPIPLLRQAAHLCTDFGDPARALAFARRAASLAPAGSGAEIIVCEALLACGRLNEAGEIAASLFARHPFNQYVVATQAIVWRLLGDPRYAMLYDYDSLVDVQQLELPSGWSSLDEFLAELAADLEALHGFHTHPLQQSVRGGSQLPLYAPELARRPIGALFRGIEAAVARYLTNVGPGGDPVRSRNVGRFAISTAWSIRLVSGGHHVDHVHPNGWLSSACYVALPRAIGKGGTHPGREGWLRFGRPCFRTDPRLTADHFVKPEAGSLVLFPAYMWHGVEPFESEEPRLAVAFDVVPG
ncbi:MAG: putative 2OG-Fe(II) oxygenase [Betaproteobacteria bacterium]